MTAEHGGRVVGRLMLMGNIPVDLTVRVARLPSAGDDVRGDSALTTPGGGFNVLHAARRAGLLGRYAGSHGTGPFGDRVREALADIGCEVVLPRRVERDSGWVVALVDNTGERTFVSSPEAVIPYDRRVLESLRLAPGDLVYVSGYSLGLGERSAPLAEWVVGVPPDHRVFCDLGPWGAEARGEILRPVLGRVDWLSCNGREATRLTDEPDAAAACAALQRRTRHAVVLVRDGARGCWVATPDEVVELVAAPAVSEVRDTNGAGDAHSGAFLAAVAAGEPLRVAVTLANAAGAEAVQLVGGASWERAGTGRAWGEEG
jgi:sugar/nucleoside kinase (ribokinase family)